MPICQVEQRLVAIWSLLMVISILPLDLRRNTSISASNDKEEKIWNIIVILNVWYLVILLRSMGGKSSPLLFDWSQPDINCTMTCSAGHCTGIQFHGLPRFFIIPVPFAEETPLRTTWSFSLGPSTFFPFHIETNASQIFREFYRSRVAPSG